MHEHPDPAVEAGNHPAGRPSRRAVLQGAAAAAGAGLALAACGGGPLESRPLPETPQLSPLFPLRSPHVVAGTPTRLPFALTSSNAVPQSIPVAQVVFSLEVDGSEVAGSVTAPVRADGVPYPYLPATLTFPEPGVYDVVARVGDERLAVTVQAYERTEVGPPQVGEPLPPVDTPTPLRSLQVSPVCTQVPPCGLHEQSLAQVVGRGRPVAVVLATPAYGTTEADRTMLGLVQEAVPKFPDVVVLHSEVYKNPKDVRKLSDAAVAPLTDAYRMKYAPALFVANSAGILVARADTVVDRAELADLLALAR
ncbi:MAG: hypothetical protein ACKO04_01405 [Actinomycetes bacterium]